ncbi:DNA primase small subunit [Beutenbergia cavernae DSM 12333]|uniref:DNA primase small subunit n=1 Tax=Beutenbergia cavernae (strain ATCC BAA-8 / DSM 12333 / CCUG 43141 / JCM 11478 / NBRC 16432 / NCIMB 13614 / HKI 0122) TaxID=471853 RepID=C5BX79_BEUC1|nr:DNA primase small subunit domain-containing protein [Beutenbergia cavernae]ACQ78754.1 DNA primase small subunit [Beutenbergia cavernae DSM 12333]
MARAQTPPVELDVAGRTVKVSSPDKVLFAGVGDGVTKLDVVRYFISVGEGILAALKERPTTLERWPQGYADGMKLTTRQGAKGDGFYSKRVPQYAPDWVEPVEITFPSGRTAEEVCPSELAVVAWAAQQGTLTFHPWPVRRPEVDSPDQLRIDLDPQPGTDYVDSARLAPLVREVAAEAGLTAVPKTSGGRGVHVFAPIEPRWSFVEARRAVIALGREVERRAPEQVTTNWWKEERGERVFIDFNQMARDRTIASAYSIRANVRATVSAPLRWDEVDQVQPDDFTVLTMPDRFAEVGDLFAGANGDADHPAGSLDVLLEWAARDERDHGLGDLPYPPEYPKMPGEPKRVQPSRDRDRPRDD